MTQIGDVVHVAHCRKAKLCDWCGEMIEVGKPAVRWLWKDAAFIATTRVHLECYTGGVCQHPDGEWTPGDFARGCLCEHGACECVKEAMGDG